MLFGPANRPLPQLPMGVNSEGYLVALSDFNDPVGPSFLGAGMSSTNEAPAGTAGEGPVEKLLDGHRDVPR